MRIAARAYAAAPTHSCVVMRRCAHAAAPHRCAVMRGAADAAVPHRCCVVMRGRAHAAAPHRCAGMGGCERVLHRSLRGSAIGGSDRVHVCRMMRRAQRPLHSRHAWMPVVHGGEKPAIPRGYSLVSALRGGCANGSPACGELRRRRPCSDSAATAVEAHARTSDGAPTDDCPINEGVPDDRSVDVDDRGVVVENAARPIASDVPDAEVAVAVISIPP